MLFKRFDPSTILQPYLKEYWIAEKPHSAPFEQKIISDGYCEIIFHYKDPYRINLHGSWETQSKALFAGQISQHFRLQSTGESGMVGLKLKPTAAYRLFGLPMDQYKDRVVDLKLITKLESEEMMPVLSPETHIKERLAWIEKWLVNFIEHDEKRTVEAVSRAVDCIFEQFGMVDVEALSGQAGLSRRHLERAFKKVIGLSPKFFSRIVRFNYIFQLAEAGDRSWIDVALRSGHFDQSHFIKNFREFTGVEPSRYGFDENTMANFFLTSKHES